jgi:undecaprenyl-diphosphatase
VEGVTEYLPVSSTGHLILTSALLGLDEPESLKNAVDTFSIVMQGGAILAIVGLYWPRLVQMLRGLLGKDPAGKRLLINLCIAFLPAVLTWPILYPLSREFLFRPIPVLIALFLGGVWMIWIDRWRKRRFANAHPDNEPAPGIDLDSITPRMALAIGLFQWGSLWPGTSRALMTIGGGMMLGLRPKAAAEFSFLLGLPTIGAACVYETYSAWKDTRSGEIESIFSVLGIAPIIIGFVVSAVVAAIVVKWFVGFLERRGLAFFGYYRVLLTLVMGPLLLMGIITLN